ncbi:hypothetical protein QTI66_38940 [Variovorax sp. J22R133]|uniref:hypothetical protein n=1 Tax=Variovorax brevis TaxID=3053503 RepID=UPI002578FB26|nr:hypothetical protein [Variovorax sp. J22R133]MDM0118053.1 hypothetical protein [Variovorax sp. J22R133]
MKSMQCGSLARKRAFVAASLAVEAAAVALCPLVDAGAQTMAQLDGAQQEADYRVIAARCGTPAFEKSFSRHSRAAVAAGLVSPNRDAAAVEKSITALRRSSLSLVTTSTDCPVLLAQLEAVQRQRNSLVKRSRTSASKP